MNVLEFCSNWVFSYFTSSTFFPGYSTFFSTFYLSALEDFLSKGFDVSLVSSADGFTCYGMAGIEVSSNFLKRGSLFF